MKTKLKIIAVFDNNGETVDQYTFICSDGTVLGTCSTGKAFSQWCGDVLYLTGKSTISEAIESYSTGEIGKKIPTSKVPKELLNHVQQRMLE